ncbi:hypothetical protein ACFQH9_18865, partial [Pseudonocardia lutea]
AVARAAGLLAVGAGLRRDRPLLRRVGVAFVALAAAHAVRSSGTAVVVPVALTLAATAALLAAAVPFLFSAVRGLWEQREAYRVEAERLRAALRCAETPSGSPPAPRSAQEVDAPGRSVDASSVGASGGSVGASGRSADAPSTGATGRWAGASGGTVGASGTSVRAPGTSVDAADATGRARGGPGGACETGDACGGPAEAEVLALAEAVDERRPAARGPLRLVAPPPRDGSSPAPEGPPGRAHQARQRSS